MQLAKKAIGCTLLATSVGAIWLVDSQDNLLTTATDIAESDDQLRTPRLQTITSRAATSETTRRISDSSELEHDVVQEESSALELFGAREQFSAESIDPEWAALAEPHISAAIADSQMALNNYELRCQTTICRLQIVHTTPSQNIEETQGLLSELRELTERLTLAEDPVIQSVTIEITTATNQHAATTTTYLHRDGRGTSSANIILGPGSMRSLPATDPCEILSCNGQAPTKSLSEFFDLTSRIPTPSEAGELEAEAR
jgi:hypothetical protein